MEQKFIDLELKALTERFQNLSREERVLKLAENKLPTIDDTHQVGDEEEITSKNKYCDMDLIILDDEGHDNPFINLSEGNIPEEVEEKDDEDENKDDGEGGDLHPTADDDIRDYDDDNQGGAGNA